MMKTEEKQSNELKELNLSELQAISGGSELSDAFWYAVGSAVGTMASAYRSLYGMGSGYGVSRGIM